MNLNLPKYTQLESERRFLVERCPDLSSLPYRLIHDIYVAESRLRLRAIAYNDGPSVEFKLCKKYSSDSPASSPIVNVYLTAEEYNLLSQLPGRALRKRRYRLLCQETIFSIDIFQDELAGLILSEVESNSPEILQTISMPSWAKMEVTTDFFFQGGNLSGVSAAELAAKLYSLR